ncbi:MAG: putative bifunctional diguanylate cyclase/phosphodiesterase [Pigmentiphaga sp.]
MFDFFTLLIVVLLLMEAVGGVLLVGWWLQRRADNALGWWALAHGVGVLLLWLSWYTVGGSLSRNRYAEFGLLGLLALAVVPALSYVVLRMARAESHVAASASQKNLFHYYASADPAQTDRLAHDLLVALGDPASQLYLQYQPIFDTRSREILGFEALVRWNHPTRGAIRPDQFIPLAEANGSIKALGRWVLETACLQAAKWPHPWTISVNLSPVQLQEHRLMREVRECLRYTGLAPERLQLEITEGVMVDTTNQILSRLRGLRELGVRVAIDDFGTGYSSLQYLERLPCDTIKIDRSFVNAIESDQAARSIASAVVRLCHELGHSVVAEGVETDGQVEILAELGCQGSQGWLLGKPMPAERIVPVFGHNPLYEGGRMEEPELEPDDETLHVGAGGLRLAPLQDQVEPEPSGPQRH